MKKLLIAVLFLVPFAASASTLTAGQVSSIISLLEAFGVSQDILTNVEAQLAPVAVNAPENQPVTSPQDTPIIVATTTAPVIPAGPVIPSFTVSNEGFSNTAYAGNNGYIFNTIQLFLSAGYEGANFSSIPMVLFAGNRANASDLNNCQIWNGAYWDGSSLPGNIPLGTGRKSVNGNTLSIGAPVQFNLDSRVTIGATQTIDLTVRCDISASAQSGGTYQWSIDTNNSDWNLTGAVAGEPISVNAVQSPAATVTIFNPVQATIMSPIMQQQAQKFKDNQSCIDSQEQQIKSGVIASGGSVDASQLMTMALQRCPSL